jgi:hypothetical protein
MWLASSQSAVADIRRPTAYVGHLKAHSVPQQRRSMSRLMIELLFYHQSVQVVDSL